jgi:hypothetical protein
MGVPGTESLLLTLNRSRYIQPRKFLLLSVFLLTFSSGLQWTVACAQTPSPGPFEPAEELLYEAEFSRSLLRKIDIADFRFTLNRIATNEKAKTAESTSRPDPASYFLLLTGDISSKGFFSKLFNLRFRQHVESTVEPRSFTVQKTKKLDEQGKRLRTSETTYDPATGKIVWTELDPNNPSRQPRTASSQFSGQVQDVLSVFYYLRTLPLAVGKTFEVSITDSGRVYQVPVEVVEKKRMKTVLGRVDTVRIDPKLFGPKGMINFEGQLSIWVTDDNRHLPVSARIKNEYGTFDIRLKKLTQAPRAELLTKQDSQHKTP